MHHIRFSSASFSAGSELNNARVVVLMQRSLPKAPLPPSSKQEDSKLSDKKHDVKAADELSVPLDIRNDIQAMLVSELRQLKLLEQQRLYVKLRDKAEDVWIDRLEKEISQRIIGRAVAKYPQAAQNQTDRLIAFVESQSATIMQALQKNWMDTLIYSKANLNQRILALNYLIKLELAIIAQHLFQLMNTPVTTLSDTQALHFRVVKDNDEVIELLRFYVSMRAQGRDVNKEIAAAANLDAKKSAVRHAAELRNLNLLLNCAKRNNFDLERAFVLIALYEINRSEKNAFISATVDAFLTLKYLDDYAAQLNKDKFDRDDSKAVLMFEPTFVNKLAEQCKTMQHKLFLQIQGWLAVGVITNLVEDLRGECCKMTTQFAEFNRLLSDNLKKVSSFNIVIKKEGDLFDNIGALFAVYHDDWFLVNHHHRNEAKDIGMYLRSIKDKPDRNALAITYMAGVLYDGYAKKSLKCDGSFIKLVVCCIHELRQAVAVKAAIPLPVPKK